METLVEYASAELEIKKSRFLAEVFPVFSQAEARSLLKQQKEKAHDAHQRIWEHEKEQDAKLADHSDRLEKLEGKK